MSKYELDGYVPLRPWARGVSYLVFIVLALMTLYAIKTDAPGLRIGLLTAALVLFAQPSAIIAFYDARVTAKLRRKGVRRVPRKAPGFAPAQFTFFERDNEWDYLNDPAPTSI